MDHHQPLKVLESSRISPPPGSVPSTTLPLTFFDLPWLTLPFGQSLFFYPLADSTSHFLHTILPNLKHSLSLTLRHFYPYAGNLICPPPPQLPYLSYSDGKDSLAFVVAESTGHDFNHLKADYPRDIKVLHSFVPKLPPSRLSPDGISTRPVMIMQLTIFPGSGICIGNTSNHVAGDGVSFVHFMKYWMAMCKYCNGDPTCAIPSLPVHDCRKVIKDPSEGDIVAGHMERFWNRKTEDDASHDNDVPSGDLVRATFSMNRTHIDNLKQWITKQSVHQPPVSTFVVTLAFTWVCLIRSLAGVDEKEDNDELFYLMINVDCRNRLECPEPIPSSYFGNCMAPGVLSVKKSELLGENGIATATKAIAGKIKEMLTSNLLKTAPTWAGDVRRWVTSRCPISIAGAPKLGLYDMDFGMGKPCKVEIVHIESGGAIAFSESRDGQDGIEVCLALQKHKMDVFTNTFEKGMSKFQQQSGFTT